MLEEQFKELMSKNWTEEDKALIDRVTSSLLYYKKLIPKTLKADIVLALQLCNNLKDKMEELERKLLEEIVEPTVEESNEKGDN
jgi:hypothetical protein